MEKQVKLFIPEDDRFNKKTYINRLEGWKWVAFIYEGRYYREYSESSLYGGWDSFGIEEISRDEYDDFEYTSPYESIVKED